jgi:hypothetical protein
MRKAFGIWRCVCLQDILADKEDLIKPGYVEPEDIGIY